MVPVAREQAKNIMSWREDTVAFPCCLAIAFSSLFSPKRVSHVPGPGRGTCKARTLTLRSVVLGKSVDFLIDSGAECSLIPSSLVPSTLITPSSINLTGVNGSPLSVQGVFSASICVPQLRREYPVNFVVTNLCPILGADFIANARLQLDMHAKRLFDVDTSLSAELKPSDSLPTQVRITQPLFHMP